MKVLSYIFIFFILTSYKTSNSSYIDYAFERNNNIYYHVFNSNNLFVINNASDPAVSPNGLKLAYRKEFHTQGNSRSDTINVFDFNSNRTYKLTTKNRYNHSPKWSPNGSFLGFTSITHNGKFSISIFDSSKLITSVIPSFDASCNNFNWLSDNKTFSINDLDSLWLIDFSGIVQKSYSMNKITKGNWITIPLTLYFSEDKKVIYFNAYNNSATCKRPPDGPCSIYQYSLLTDSLIKLTGNELQCRGNFVTNGQQIYVSAYTACNKYNISIFKVDNLHTKEVIKNAENITVAKKNSL